MLFASQGVSERWTRDAQSKLYRPTSKSTVVVLRYVDLVHVMNHVVLLLWIRYLLLILVILAINRSTRARSVHRTGHHVF